MTCVFNVIPGRLLLGLLSSRLISILRQMNISHLILSNLIERLTFGPPYCCANSRLPIWGNTSSVLMFDRGFPAFANSLCLLALGFGNSSKVSVIDNFPNENLPSVSNTLGSQKSPRVVIFAVSTFQYITDATAARTKGSQTQTNICTMAEASRRKFRTST